MDASEVARHWDANADAWTALARAGYDVYRDLVNTPAFLAMLPPVHGLRGLDVGCGEGHHARLLRERGAEVEAIDVSQRFLGHARAAETERPLGIRYLAACATRLPFHDQSFDFAIATMSLMDVPDHAGAIRETHRVLRPGGFLQASMVHPCANTPVRFWVRDDAGERVAMALGGYFDRLDGEIEEWTFGAAPSALREQWEPFRIPRFTRTLSGWLNLFLESGFRLERVEEPCASEETARLQPHVADTRIAPYFLHVRLRRAP